MKVFKFGGASVKDAGAVRNVAGIIRSEGQGELAVVISAMGKTTNALEEVVRRYFKKSGDPYEKLREVYDYHEEIIQGLFPEPETVLARISNLFVEIEWVLEDEPNGTYDFIYDQIVSQGEMMSTVIVAAFLEAQGLAATWADARDLIRTDNTYREAKVDWQLSEVLTKACFSRHPGRIILTQGFIGGTSENYTTTLGREGSDYSAAILAYILGAESVTIWKDVPGVLNADPKWFSDCVLIREMSYQDALELAYYGASVIHPKTIRPLQNAGIPLLVRSFKEPQKPCTEISIKGPRLPIPGFIFKVNQVLISISPKDFSFIVEENLRDIFDVFSRHRVKMNIMQNSALSFSVCSDFDEEKFPDLLRELSSRFLVRYNHPLELITVRYADEETLKRVLENKEILLDVRSRNTVQMVVRDQG